MSEEPADAPRSRPAPGSEPAAEPDLRTVSTVRAGRLIGRNLLALVASQFVTTPVSMVVTALMARSLGATHFGAIYLATTVLTVPFLLVEWGGYSQAAALVARNRAMAPSILGTGLALRVLGAGLVLGLVPIFGRVMQYDEIVQSALRLCALRLAFVSVGLLCSAVLRGFERIRWHAAANVAASLMDAVLSSAVLLSGGDLRAVLIAQAVAAALGVGLQLAMIARLKIGRWRVDRAAAALLVGGGFSFMLLEIILKLQPYIDVTFMEKLAEPQALGWHSAATRILGVLLFPASTLSVALYPTLVRLWQDDRATCSQVVRLGLRAITVLGVLIATGTAMFSHVVVGLIYGQEGYGPAAANLSILSAYLLLVYASIVLGTVLTVSGRQLKYAMAQSLCLVVSIVLDPVLIPWAQHTYGNGGIGVCLSVVTAEVLMVGAGLALLPSGPLDWTLLRTLGRCLLAALGMALVGVALLAYPFVAMPASVVTYAALLWAQREVDPDLLALLRRRGLSEVSP